MPSTSGVVASANRSLEIAWLTTVAADNPLLWVRANDPITSPAQDPELAQNGSFTYPSVYFTYYAGTGVATWRETGIVPYSGNYAIYTTNGPSDYQNNCINLTNALESQAFGRDINNANAFTMECIIKFEDNTSTFTYGRYDANALAWGMLITQTSGKFYGTAWVGNLFDIGVDGDTGVTIDYNKWYHIVYTYAPTRSRLYINGSLVLERTFASYTWPQYWPTQEDGSPSVRRNKISLLAAWPLGGPGTGALYNPTYNCTFDELVMYKSTLSYTQVAEHAFASGVLSQ